MIVRKIDLIFNQTIEKYIINDAMIVCLLEPRESVEFSGIHSRNRFECTETNKDQRHW